MVVVWFLLACTPGEAPSDGVVQASDTSSVVDTAATDDGLGTPTGDTATASSTDTGEALLATALASADQGYACDRGFQWVAHDEGQTVRLTVGVDLGAPQTEPSEEGQAFIGQVGLGAGEALVMLATGSCLSTPGCSDFGGGECAQELDRVWVGTAGTVELLHASGGLEGELVDLRLEEVDQQLEVLAGGGVEEAAVLELGHRAYWVE